MRVRNIFRLFMLAAFAVTVIFGCGGGGGGGGSSVVPQPINTAPTISVVDPNPNPATLDVGEHSSMSICFKAEDKDGGDLSYVCTWNAGAVTPAQGKVKAGSECTVAFSAPNFNGRCTVTVTISDGQASAAKSVQIDVIGAGSQPQNELRVLGISVSPDRVAPGANAALSASVQNPGGKILTYAWESPYGKATGNGTTATWTAPNQAGVYGVYLKVSDGDIEVKHGIAVTVAGPEGGLLGQYFVTLRENNVVNLQTEVLRRVDPVINFNWYKLSPDPAKLGGDGWGARWTGYIKAQDAGTYTFRAHVDDGVRMSVMNDAGAWVGAIPNNKDNWMDHVEGAWLPEQPVPIQLNGGKWYPILIDYFEGAEEAYIVLYWSVNGGSEEIVPQTVLKPQ